MSIQEVKGVQVESKLLFMAWYCRDIVVPIDKVRACMSWQRQRHDIFLLDVSAA